MVADLHLHGRRSHQHPHSEVPHQHLLRAICGMPECRGFPTHDIHPRAGAGPTLAGGDQPHPITSGGGLS
jgi:hypothetical protein